MKLPVALRRQGYRAAHRALRAWWFVTHPSKDGIKCVLTDDDHVLLVRHTYGRPGWDLPGGTVRRDEPPLEAARREMEEELGVWLEALRPLGEIQARAYGARDTLHCFEADLSAAELTVDRGELAEVRWFPRDQLPADVSRYVSRILALARDETSI